MPSLLTCAAVVGIGLVLLAERAAAREPDISRNEIVLFRSRPRKALYRYALSLGLWEMNRKTTSYAVTTRRLIVEHGLLRRRSRSIPLSAIAEVDLDEGLWEGAVRISERAGGENGVVEIGPLRAPTARRLAPSMSTNGNPAPLAAASHNAMSSAEIAIRTAPVTPRRARRRTSVW